FLTEVARAFCCTLQLSGLPTLTRETQCLLLGDLNTTPFSPYFSKLLDETGLQNSARGFGLQASWPSLLSVLGIPLDHVLHSEDIVVVDRSTRAGAGSDHRAVIVDFQSASKK
ncbi:MAG: endonuclease/exonuclease/phosphatase family protein, partial [Planctomycetota bacterium]